MAIVASASRSHEGAPVFDIQRIAKVGLPDSTILVACLVSPVRARIAKPLRQRMFFIIRHQPEGQRLPMPARFFECGIDNLPTSAIGGRLQFVPEPAAVRHGRIWKSCSGRISGLLCRWPRFGPTEALIQGLAVETLKRRDSPYPDSRLTSSLGMGLTTTVSV